MKIMAQAGSDYPGVRLSIDQGAWLGCALRQARINGWRGRANPALPVPLALALLMLAQPQPLCPVSHCLQASWIFFHLQCEPHLVGPCSWFPG